MTDRLALRDHLVDALHADCVGPYQGRHAADTDQEVLEIAPSRWYLTGFLAPRLDRDPADETAQEEMGAGSDAFEEESPGQEPEPKQKKQFPASLGLSVLLPPNGEDRLQVVLTYADYRRAPWDNLDGPQDARKAQWVRNPMRVERDVPLNAERLSQGILLEETEGLWLRGKLETVLDPEAQGLRPGTRALSLFVVNERPEGPKGRRDEAFVFQVGLRLSHPAGFVPRPNRRGEKAKEWDDRVADLQYRNRFEYAVGHGVSVAAEEAEADAASGHAHRVTTVATTWLPTQTVPRVKAREVADVEVGMDALAALADGAAVKAALGKLPAAYRAWIQAQRALEFDAKPRAETRDALMDRAEFACRRIQAGIDRLAEDPQAREAFGLANRAMADQARAAGMVRAPAWRLFQLAFLLLNVSATVDATHPDRSTVELIFFPTGGGKTEAYLGLIAFTLLLRRLEGRSRPDEGLGVAVLLRYTLRLLTLDQLGRAARLICALEQIRQTRPDALGEVRFAIGLWVGKSAAANRMEEIREQLTQYALQRAGSPFPLAECPWCGTAFSARSFTIVETGHHKGVRVACLRDEDHEDGPCAFSLGENPEGLPVLFVDEQLYRELPCFVVGTVDKFALMPWRGEVGLLFGRASAREGREFFGPMDPKPPKSALPLKDGLRPPELIVQDELHLISGPLGTMVGLYETAIEALCVRKEGEDTIVPKIVASTATVRRAHQQIRALYGRRMEVFPPPGPDEFETFFSEVDHDTPGRMYVGLAAPGRSLKSILIRGYVDLLAAAKRLHQGETKALVDPYLTVTGYFNSLRELGGMRRLVEDDVRSLCDKKSERRPRHAPLTWFASRKVKEPQELTSRESTERVKETKRQVEAAFDGDKGVDVLLASNMISVGVDIDRLGLMVVAGQPKTTSEYIQASSRVGRPSDLPGLVVTCFNLVKPRDRSHYERFQAYHQSFYRAVEAQSITPFAGPALERGLVGAVLSVARHLHPEMTPQLAVMELVRRRAEVEAGLQVFATRAGIASEEGDGQSVSQWVHKRVKNILDQWARYVDSAEASGAKRSYSPWEKPHIAKSILRMALDEDPEEDAKFVAPTSMRDVESVSHLWLKRGRLSGGGA